MANNNFKAFEFGIRIATGLASDPIEGKLGEMYYNTTRNVIRICISTSPLIWHDLFLQPGVVNDSTIQWDDSSKEWIENTDLLINSNKIYSKDDIQGSDIIIQSGDSSGNGNNGGGIDLIAGNGGTGGQLGTISVKTPLIERASEDDSTLFTIKGNDSNISGNGGGDISIIPGNGSVIYGTQESTDITCTADVGGQLSNKYFYLNSPTEKFYVWYNSQTGATKQKESLTIIGDHSDFTTTSAGDPGYYWTFSDDSTQYYVWYHNSDTNFGVDPAIAGKTGIQVDFLDTDTAPDISNRTKLTLDNSSANTTQTVIDSTTFSIEQNVFGVTPDLIDLGTVTSSNATTAILSYAHDDVINPNIEDRKEIQVIFNVDDSATTIATKTANAITQYASQYITASSIGDTITVNSISYGSTENASAETSGFTINVTQQGSDSSGLPGKVVVGGNGGLFLQSSKVNIAAQHEINPPDPLRGDIYYNIKTKRFMKYDGSNWTWIEDSYNHNQIASITLRDDTLTSLPVDTSTTIDGETIVDKDTVLFTKVYGYKNKIMKATVVGTAISWEKIALGQNINGVPENGDLILINKGSTYKNTLYQFDRVAQEWIGIDDKNLSQINQNSGIYLTGGGNKTYEVDLNYFRWDKDLYINIPGIIANNNKIPPQVLELNPNEVAYVIVDKNSVTPVTLTPIIAPIQDVPFNSPIGNNVVIFLRRTIDDYIFGIGGNDENKDGEVVYERRLFDNQTNITIKTLSKSDNQGVIIDYTLTRDNQTEIGRLFLTHAGTNGAISGENAFTADLGVDFSVDASSSNTILWQYSTDNTGSDAILRWKMQKIKIG